MQVAEGAVYLGWGVALPYGRSGKVAVRYARTPAVARIRCFHFGLGPRVSKRSPHISPEPSLRHSPSVVLPSMWHCAPRCTEASSTLALVHPSPAPCSCSYDDRTGTARLSTARYGSREANRKLLTEHFASLLRATATAAGAGGAGAAAPAAAAI